MRIVIAPDSFKGNLSCQQVAAYLKEGIHLVEPSFEVCTIPLADGGEGTAHIITTNSHGVFKTVEVTGPLLQKVVATFGLIDDNTTAVLDMASASGLSLVPENKRNPMETTTFGTGEVIRAALDCNVRRIIIGIGGSATTDGGIGLLSALGFKFLDKDGKQLIYGGKELLRIASIDSSSVDPRLKTVEITVASDVTNPLTGINGAARIFGPQKGATPEMVKELDAGLSHLQDVWEQEGFISSRTSSSSTPIISSSSSSSSWLARALPRDAPGDGAAGGLGAALRVCLPSKMAGGAQTVLKCAGFHEQASEADLVVTCEGKADDQTAQGKLCSVVASECAALNPPIPVVLIAGCVDGNVMGMLDTFTSVQSTSCGEESLKDMIENSPRDLRLAGANLARMLKLGGLIERKKKH